MANKPVALDEQSMRRVWRQVKRDEYTRPNLPSQRVDPPQVPQIYTMVRVANGEGESVTASVIKAAFISEGVGYDFESLNVTCDEDAPDLSSETLYDVNHASFIEGCVLPEDLFQVVNIGGYWHAIGCAHTAVRGTYNGDTGALTLIDCRDLEVPVVPLVSDFVLTDGDTYLAQWVRADRVYVVTAAECSEV